MYDVSQQFIFVGQRLELKMVKGENAEIKFHILAPGKAGKKSRKSVRSNVVILLMRLIKEIFNCEIVASELEIGTEKKEPFSFTTLTMIVPDALAAVRN
jgi:hypothetical protein